ncbi:hypothetical protein [Falsiroseomonas sp. E2-1-a20]|uniref:hypothetical protein n=1 Tax=Falsiroseomonas sp. E2-1-a20 TaxID=3239300 RepID=UPI003F2D00F1
MKALTMPIENDGRRIGRYVVVQDIDGRTHALSVTAVAAICSDDNEGSVLLLPAGRLVRVDAPLEQAAAWFNGKGQR